MPISKEKQQILLDNEHNIKVVAGPGSGKTTLILEKVRRLVEAGVNPERILIITYTNRAADDLEYRLSKIVKQSNVYLHTFHGFCRRFLYENPIYFRHYKGFKILDELGQLLFIVKFNREIKATTTNSISPNDLMDLFGRIKDNFQSEELEKLDHPLKPALITYCRKLNEEKKLDFGDLINVVIDEMRKNKKLADVAIRKFDYIFIDEYQDANRNQEKLVRYFLNKKTKLFVVGDRNQSIYGFRGSDITLFDTFEKRFDNVKIYRLSKNFRSTQEIISLSNRFLSIPEIHAVQGNSDPTDGPININGSKPFLIEYDDEKNEAEKTVEDIKDHIDRKIVKQYSDIAILLKSVRKDSKRFISYLDKYNIPYEIVGDGGLFEREDIRGILDCINQLGKGEIRIVNAPLKVNVPASSFNDAIKSGPLSVVYKIVEHSRYYREAILHDDDKALFNLGKLSKILTTQVDTFGFDRSGKYIAGLYDNLIKINPAFLDSEQPKFDVDNSVKILTLHKAKGLEFPVVYVCGLNKDNYKINSKDNLSSLFPNYKPTDDMWRALYVAISRPKQRLVVSYYQNPADYVQPMKSELVYFKKYGQQSLLAHLPAEQPIASEQIDPEPIKLTYYKLNEFIKCPFAYKLRYYYEFQIPRSFTFTYGSILHSLLYHLNLSIKSKIKPNLEEIISKTPSQLAKFDFHRPIVNYLSLFKDKLDNIHSVEPPFEFTISDAIISGRMDMVIMDDGLYKIVEFKSGKWNIEREKNAIKQVSLYALSNQELNIKNGIIYFFDPGGRLIETTIDVSVAKKELEQAISTISKRQFKPNTKQCQNCVFKKYRICPYYKNNGDGEADTDDLDASQQDFSGEI
jgi:DNA helicase-2/ATP-dependent DNA helicase PcrA